MNNTFRERRSRAQIAGTPGQPTGISLEAFRKFRHIEVPLLAELDRRPITVRELLALAVGDLLPLSRPVGENIDLIAGDTLLGNAEILALDDKLAVRVADVSSKDPVVGNRREPPSAGTAEMVPSAITGGVAREGNR